MFDITKPPAPRKAPVPITLEQIARRWGWNSVQPILCAIDNSGLFMVGNRDYQLILEMEISA